MHEGSGEQGHVPQREATNPAQNPGFQSFTAKFSAVPALLIELRYAA